MNDLPDNHDLNHLKVVLEFVDCREFAIDVGAHRGIWTQELAGAFDRVHAFEPIKKNFDRIPDALNVVKHNVALGDEEDIAYMAPGKENTGQCHIANLGEQVNMKTLDSYNFKPDFIKIYAEGYELKVLEGAQATISQNKPLILLELNGLSERYGYTDQDVKNWLIARGYREALRRNKDYLFVI